jgi:hypothetical protein
MCAFTMLQLDMPQIEVSRPPSTKNDCKELLSEPKKTVFATAGWVKQPTVKGASAMATAGQLCSIDVLA